MQQYEEHIQPDAIQVSLPEELHPVPAAFGGDIGQALERGGHEIQSRVDVLSTVMARMNYYRQLEAATQKDTEFQTGYGEWLRDGKNTTTKTRNLADNQDPANLTLSASTDEAPQAGMADKNIQQYEVPTGPLARKGYAAAGALEDAHAEGVSRINAIMQQAKAEGMPMRAQQRLFGMMSRSFATLQSGVGKHEAEQLDIAQTQTMSAHAGLMVNNMAGITDPNAIVNSINGIKETYNTLGDMKGWGQDEKDLMSEKAITMGLQKAAVTQLKTVGGDPTQFKTLLDQLHTAGKIDDGVYATASKHLDEASKVIISHNVAQSKINKVNDRFDALNKLAQGKFDITNQNVVNDYASKDPELGNALNTVIDSKGDFKLTRNDKEDIDYQKAVTKMVNSSDQEQLSGYLINSLKEKNGISQTHLNILVNALSNHAKTLPVLDGQPDSPIPQNTSTMAFNALNQWADKADLTPKDKTALVNNYLSGMAKNVPAKQNYDNAVYAHMIKAYPKTATMEFPPTDIDAKSEGFNKAVNFAKDAKIYPQQRLNMKKVESPLKGLSDEYGLEK